VRRIALALTLCLLAHSLFAQDDESYLKKKKRAFISAAVAITYAATCTNTGLATGSSVSCTSALTIAAGTYIVLTCSDGGSTTDTMTAGDGTNSYGALSSVVSESGPGESQIFGFYYSSGGTFTPKCSFSASVSGTWLLATTYLHVASSGSQDGSAASGTGSSGTSATTTGSIAASQCGDVFVEMANFNGTGTNTVTSPFTMRSAPSGIGFGQADYISTTTATQAGAMAGPSGQWLIIEVALKAASHC
jgi:hypothetical protein